MLPRLSDWLIGSSGDCVMNAASIGIAYSYTKVQPTPVERGVREHVFWRTSWLAATKLDHAENLCLGLLNQEFLQKIIVNIRR